MGSLIGFVQGLGSLASNLFSQFFPPQVPRLRREGQRERERARKREQNKRGEGGRERERERERT